MNLIIDVGNSYVKLAVFQNFKIKSRKVCGVEDFIKEFKKIRNEFKNIKKVIISSVGRLERSQIDVVKIYYDVLCLTHDTKLPFKNFYKTPKTLGVDRMALVSASVQQFKNKNVLIIDAGSCITYDFISYKNEYYGGAISPGIRLRYQSLHNLTANLPLLESKIPKDIIGDSTASSIHSGVQFGIINEIDGVIDTYKQKHVDLTIILTGGDTDFLSKQLKNGIFANSNFLLEGLNFILEFNSN
ncbi:pantothenate kinase [Flavobacteriales bacterium 34_180_T64]|nr:pantothenate kinase [Flavobacteriales bacterium 34_180_T64]